MVKHLVWEEFWNTENPRKHLPGAPSQAAAVGLLPFSTSFSQHRECNTDLEVAHSRQGMVSTVASL